MLKKIQVGFDINSLQVQRCQNHRLKSSEIFVIVVFVIENQVSVAVRGPLEIR